MKIGVDCHVLAGKFQGSKTYLEKLYNEVLKIDSENEYVFLGHWRGKRPFGEQAQHVEYRTSSRWDRLSIGTRLLVRTHGLSLLHSSYISPLSTSCDQLLTIHDLLFETHPQHFERAFVYRSKLLVRYSAKKARQIHTISEFTRAALQSVYGIEPERIKLVPVGVDLDYFNANGVEAARARVKKKIGLAEYILTVGRLEPRKNNVTLLKAYALHRHQFPDTGPLVIVGQKDFGYKQIYSTMLRLRLREHVHILETIDHALLPDIYKAARMFVYPSFAEGFGIPPLEAMACGIPVITSNNTAIPEVVGESAILIDPDNVEMLAEAIGQVHSDTELHARLSAEGPARAKQWTWAKAASAYVRALADLK